ncbi:MAG TPA: MFS transporter [Cytophaga sp.]|jgi:predicted MFS family arabinose efflux permease|nr:MFS transporter [Cytophaga sp.]
MNTPTPEKPAFSRYQIFIIVILSVLQFSVILDFMVLSPLGASLMPELDITTTQFGFVVSAYAFSAGASGLLAAGFADRFDRKILLLFFYIGFIVGTVLCAIAPTYHLLLIARIVTGIFGGVISGVGFAIITDLFKMEVRGQVMGFVQTAFAASQILGIPVGLLLANQFTWHAPFWLIAGFSVLTAIVIAVYMQPITGHLAFPSTKKPFEHLWKTLTNNDYLKGFVTTTVLATGGYMLMPFGSAFSTNNLGLSIKSLPLLYGITGVFTIFLSPLLGKLSDKIGKFNVFMLGTIVGVVIVAIYSNLGPTPFWLVTVLNVLLFVGITSRIISSSALMSTVPDPQDRGAFMSINSSVQQISGGIAASIAGMIVIQHPSGMLENYNILGYTVIVSMLCAIVLMYRLDQHVKKKFAAKKV